MIGWPTPTDWSEAPNWLMPLNALAVGVGVYMLVRWLLALVWWLLAKVSGPE